MGIFDRLRTLLSSNMNDLIARAENPEKMLEQVIIDMREQQTKAKQEVALAIAEERKLKAQVEQEARQAQEWERRAMMAIQQNREDLARQALLRQQEYAERARSLHETWQRQAADTERVKDALRQLQTKIEEAQRKKNLLIAKQKRAQAQRRIHETMAGLSDTSAFETFERMAQKIEHNERLALASAEVAEELSGDSLEKQFKSLEAGATSEDIEYRLLEMKQRLGLPTGQPAAGAQPLAAGAGAPQLGAGTGTAAPGHDAYARDAELVPDDGSAHTAPEAPGGRPALPPLSNPTQAQPGGGLNDRDLAAQIDSLRNG
ncbi:MAG TPA: PspA/IM30 family protein [Longimicrobium sp.]|nr:PspA/IM30 family protein [Longimicrobium sp.]